jgi:ArsR family transcriptional regulator
MTDPAMLAPGEAPRFDSAGLNRNAAARAAVFLRALAHEGRLEVLCQLIDGELSVGEIEARLGMPQAKVSQLLMRLRAEGLVEARRDGRRVLYRLQSGEIGRIIAVLRDMFCKPAAPA